MAEQEFYRNGQPKVPLNREYDRDVKQDEYGRPKSPTSYNKRPGLKERMTFGQTLIRELDMDLNCLTLEQHKRLLKIKNGEQVANILHRDLGDPLFPDLKSAAEIFGDLVKHGTVVPNLLISLRFFCVAQNMLVLEDLRDLMNQRKLSAKEKIEIQKCASTTVSELNKVITYAETLAKRCGFIPVLARAKKGKVAAPKPAAPMVMPELE